MSINLPVCPEGCEAKVPTVTFDECNPKINYGQLCYLYVGNPNQPFINWENPAEWASRLSQSSADKKAIRKLTVIGDKPQPDQSEKEISGKRIVIGPKKHLVNFRIDETNPTNHAFLRQLECGGKFSIWYESCDGLLWGGNDGVEASLKLDEIIPEDDEDVITFTGTAKWTSKFTPERITSPIT